MNLNVSGKVHPNYWRKPLRLMLLMKLCFFLLTTVFLQVSIASSYAQLITFNEGNIPITKAFENIKSQSDYHFFWRGENLKLTYRLRY